MYHSSLHCIQAQITLGLIREEKFLFICYCSKRQGHILIIFGYAMMLIQADDRLEEPKKVFEKNCSNEKQRISALSGRFKRIHPIVVN